MKKLMLLTVALTLLSSLTVATQAKENSSVNTEINVSLERGEKYERIQTIEEQNETIARLKLAFLGLYAYVNGYDDGTQEEGNFTEKAQALNNSIQNLSEQNQEMNQTIISLRKNLTKQENKVENLSEKKSNVSEKLGEFRNKTENLNESLRIRKEKVENLTDRIISLNTTAESYRNKTEEMNQTLREKNERIDTLETQLQEEKEDTGVLSGKTESHPTGRFLKELQPISILSRIF
jgi:chromosome segregation ATPase